jgi:hypothetical protein
MITNHTEYKKAEDELRDLQKRLQRLQETHPLGAKGFTKAGIRKMIARLASRQNSVGFGCTSIS